MNAMLRILALPRVPKSAQGKRGNLPFDSLSRICHSFIAKKFLGSHRCLERRDFRIFSGFSNIGNFKKEADNVECRGDFNSISMRLAHFRFANGRRDKGGGNRRDRRFARNSKHDSKQENIA